MGGFVVSGRIYLPPFSLLYKEEEFSFWTL